ncbi:DUF2779 domain-containing protein [bacterium]|nr:DUF2779 domain-containing protein [bacterium]
MPAPRPISKSRYLNGLQCPKLLWNQIHARERIPPPDPAQQHIFDTGHEVGDLAKKLYPGGIEVAMNFADPAETARETAALMARPREERVPIFEASFLVEGRYCRVDVLVPVEDGRWNLVEVKSSTRVRDVNVNDVAFQCDTLTRAGVALGQLFIMHVNTGYVRGEAFEVRPFFHLEEVTTRVKPLLEYVPRAVERMHATLAGSEPDVPIGPRCHTPYDCPLVPLCWADLPPGNVTELYRGGRRAFGFLDEGLFKIADLPDDQLSPTQRIQARTLRTGEPHVEAAALRAWLDALAYPLHHLDFETMNPAVPPLAGLRPYQRLPFQFSLHIQDAPGAPARHVDFLATAPADPRGALVAALHAIGDEGHILAWNMGFEKGVLDDLAEAFPDEAEWLAGLADRLVDLIDPFRHFWFHHPDQKGSCSLKAVLPALTGKDYAALEIADGHHAARAYVEAVFGQADEAAREQVFADLRRYCALDTLAMVEILSELEKVAPGGA